MLNNNQNHLDIGCGAKPRNPYGYSNLYGIDIYQDNALPSDIIFKLANLTTQAIPFEDNTFDSISAFDFIEHVPRVLAMGNLTRFPFVELMNEAWRVLKPNGLLYAQTPAYPHPAAFQDPTHVNFITNKTHKYFCGAKPEAAIYGFKGQFEVVQVKWIRGERESIQLSAWAKIKIGFRRITFRKKSNSHLLWELRAIK